MMQEVEVLKTIQELICSFFSEEQFTLSFQGFIIDMPSVFLYNRRKDKTLQNKAENCHERLYEYGSE